MPGLEQWLLFLPMALLITAAPGPDNLAVLALGVSRGRAASLGFGLGCAAGCLNHTLLAVIGVSALIAASPTAFALMQYAGAAYLIWIGLRSLRHAGHSRPGPTTTQGTATAGDFWRHFRRGLLANAINPKVALFFLAFLPQFVRPEQGDPGGQLALLGLVFTACTALLFGLLALGAARAGTALRARPAIGRALDRATGLLFLGLGLRLALGDLTRMR